MPQALQLAGSVCSSTQAPPQDWKPLLQTKPHTELAHVAVPWAGAVQTMPQPPQLWVLLVVSTQLPPQLVCPCGHETTQLPPAHTWFAPQTVPQAPQLFLSLCSLTQAVPHAEKAASQEMPHCAFWQVAPPFAGAGQEVPQAPQLVTVVLRSTQALPHRVKPGLQVNPQVPPLHAGVALTGAVQTSPQVPQLEVSVATVTQELVQLVVPCGQDVVQTPPAQTWLVPHAMAQAPQLFLSDCSLTQAVPQSV